MHDVIIIGGGFAGLTAALQLGRARRGTLVLDTGLPRNRFAAEAHGVLGHDGRPPREILRLGREQLVPYATVKVVEQLAVSAGPAEGGFAVTLGDGSVVSARRLVLAYGVRDEMPDIPGASDCWGISLLHCPYCHGFEVRDRRLAALVQPDFVLHAAKLYREWGRDLTIFTNGAEPNPGDAEKLAALGVPLVTAPIDRMEHAAGRLSAIVTTAGRIERDAIFMPPITHFTSPIGESLGCRIEPTSHGRNLVVGDKMETSVSGVFAAGDIIGPIHSIPLALSSGSDAGSFSHQSLLF